MKQKTNSGAKKRFRRAGAAGMKVKRGQARTRHLLKNRNHKNKRHLAAPAYVSDANMIQMRRLLVF